MINLLIGAAVLVWLLVRQLSVRPLRDRSILPLLLLVIGVVEIANFATQHSVGASDIGLLVVSTLIGAALAFARGFTVRIWSTGNQTVRQGTIWTALLWLVAIGQHFLIESFVHQPGLAETSLLAYFGVALLVQRATLLARARNLGFMAPAVAR